MPDSRSSHGYPAQRQSALKQQPLPHAGLGDDWQKLSEDVPQRAPQRLDVPQRASQRPLPHETGEIQNFWDEVSQDAPQRPSQRPLPHVTGDIQRGWAEIKERASQRPLPHVTGDIQKHWADVSTHLAPSQAGSPTLPSSMREFDLEAFRNFAPLLSASTNYACQTGFRFRSTSFDGLEEVATALAQVSSTPLGTSHVAQALKMDASAGSRIAAKITAAPKIKEFRARLATGEPALMEELEKAYRIVVAESARNMMIATVKGMNLFPPSPTPQGIASDDCSYEDASAPLPMIGQRLYNDQQRRLRDEGIQGLQQKRAMTAAFLVDYSHHAGVRMPESPETYQSLLREFQVRQFEFADREAAANRAAAEFEATEKAFEVTKRAAAERAADLQCMWKAGDADRQARLRADEEAMKEAARVSARPPMPVRARQQPAAKPAVPDWRSALSFMGF